MSCKMMSLIGQVRDQAAHWAYIEGSISSIQYQNIQCTTLAELITQAGFNIRIVVAVTKYHTLKCYAGH